MITSIATYKSAQVIEQVKKDGFVEIVLSRLNYNRGTAEQINSLDLMLKLLIQKGYTVTKENDLCKMETVWRITKP